jgi:hypothetical protein
MFLAAGLAHLSHPVRQQVDRRSSADEMLSMT